MKFSQRIGKKSISKTLQIESMDDELRNRLWNATGTIVLQSYEELSRYNSSHYTSFFKNLWHNFYKLPIDTLSSNRDNKEILRKNFFNSEWFEVYDLLEFICQYNLTYDTLEEFQHSCNSILENEFSGYRFVNRVFSPITNENEIKEIEESVINTQQFTGFQGANTHLQSALAKLSDKKNPDYRNSIKESISAVESVAKVISDNDKDSLGAALDTIKGKIKLHTALEKGFKQLYGYTSDGDGIRHALMEESNCDFEDAKYMLVSCSAFINYLIVKAEKAGMTIE